MATTPENERSWKLHLVAAVFDLAGALLLWFWAGVTAWAQEIFWVRARHAARSGEFIDKIIANIIVFPHETFGPALGALLVALLGLVPLLFCVWQVILAAKKYGR